MQTKSEFDVYRSGTFYMKGIATDEKGERVPMELAITPDTVYMLTRLDSADVGILVEKKKTYMIYDNARIYCELSALLMKTAELDPAELMDEARAGYSELDSLSEAQSLGDATVNGQKCRQYRFLKSDGNYSVISMNGSKLVQIKVIDSKGAVQSVIDFEKVTDSIPAEKKAPPASYKKVNMISFMAELSKVVDV